MIVCLRTVVVPPECSEVHRAVSYRPIIRYEVTGGYLNLPALTACDPSPSPRPRRDHEVDYPRPPQD